MHKKINLSSIDDNKLTSCESLINYLIDNGCSVLINDYGYGIEYELCEIEDNFNDLMKFIEF